MPSKYRWWYIWEGPSIAYNGGRRPSRWFLQELKKRDPLAYVVWNPNARRIIIKKGPMAGKMMQDGRWEIWRENWNGAIRHDYKIMTVFQPSKILISQGEGPEKKYFTKQAYLGEYRDLDMRALWQMEGKKWEHQGVKGGTQDPMKAREAREKLDAEENREDKDRADKKLNERIKLEERIEKDIERDGLLEKRTGILVGKHAQLSKEPVMVGTPAGPRTVKKEDAAKISSLRAYERMQNKKYGVWPVVDVKEKKG